MPGASAAGRRTTLKILPGGRGEPERAPARRPHPWAVPLVLGILALLALAGVAARAVLHDLPPVDVIVDYAPLSSPEVEDRAGRILLLATGGATRKVIPLDSISANLVEAIVTSEDDTFWTHGGLNFREIWEAARLDLSRGRFAHGASTLTQQVVRNVALTKKKTLKRKIQEAILALELERRVTKRRILDLYMSVADFGHGLRGAEAAARYYFDRRASELTLSQATILASMLPNPKYYDPYLRPDKVRERQEGILDRMERLHWISPEEIAQVLAAPMGLRVPEGARYWDVADQAGETGLPLCTALVLDRALGPARKRGRTAPLRTPLDFALSTELDARLHRVPLATLADRVLLVRRAGATVALACLRPDEAASDLTERVRGVVRPDDALSVVPRSDPLVAVALTSP